MKRKAPNRKYTQFGEKRNMLMFLCDLNCTKGSHRKCLVLCDCGTLKAVGFTVWNKGKTKSCGCLKSKTASERFRTHGKTGTKIHNTWRAMIARCYHENNQFYYLYGLRGITVCDKWQEFSGFFEDMGDSWVNGLTIDRIDSNGSYCLENCKWSTAGEQAINRGKFKNNTSGRTGVSKSGSKWVAYVSQKGKMINLGLYKTFEEAVLARENAELHYYGFIKE